MLWLSHLPLERLGPYSTYSFSLLCEAPLLSSTTHTGKAVVEDISDCSPDQLLGVINLGLTLLDSDESSVACPFLITLSLQFPGEDLVCFSKFTLTTSHSSSQLIHPFNTYLESVVKSFLICAFSRLLCFFLTSSLQSVHYPLWEASIYTIPFSAHLCLSLDPKLKEYDRVYGEGFAPHKNAGHHTTKDTMAFTI